MLAHAVEVDLHPSLQHTLPAYTGQARLPATLVNGTQARSKAPTGHIVKEKEMMLLQARQHYEPRILCKSAGTLSTFAISEFG